MTPAKVEPAEDVIYQALQNEIVLLNMKSQQYFGLDDVGSDVWRLLVEHGDVQKVADLISTDYEVDMNTVRQDVEVLVERLLATGLLRAAEPARYSTVG